MMWSKISAGQLESVAKHVGVWRFDNNGMTADIKMLKAEVFDAQWYGRRSSYGRP